MSLTTTPLDPATLARLAKAHGITSDSRAVQPGTVFLAYPGRASDGRQYIADAVRAGSPLILWDPVDFTWPSDLTVAHQPVANLRDRASEIAGDFYGAPSQKLWMVGVTGTNGKTSVAQWSAACLDVVRGPAAVLGTIGNGRVGALTAATQTTPDAVTLQQTLAAFASDGVQSVAMEVSSHALDQGRAAGVKFDVAVFTNLTRDHLDYHGSMEAYGEAKARLFRMPSIRWAVINADDPFGQRLMIEAQSDRARVLTYGLESGQIRARDLQLSASGCTFTIDNPCGVVSVTVPVLGRFNVANVLATFAVLIASGLTAAAAAERLQALRPVRGRMETVTTTHGYATVVVDYAHTPDALEQALLTLRALLRPMGRLLCVFGCGGDRDRGKRPLMGAIAARFADAVIITSDNPRSEDPAAIAAEVSQAMSPPPYRIELDRRAAIAAAIAAADADDIVLVAGKGHETEQIIAGVRYPFDDAAIAREILHA
jgi:UDP-N-acetylmuramyl-tripeptide synthetase